MLHHAGRIRRGLKQWLAVVIVIVGMAGGSVSAQLGEDWCASVVVPLIQQTGLDVAKSAPALHCRQDGAGQWSMPTVADIADPSASANLDPRGQQLLQAVDHMVMDNAFARSLRFDRPRAMALVPGAGGVIDEIDISHGSLGPVPNWMHYVRDSYERSMMTYLTRTAGDEVDLVSYMEWYVTRRDITLSTLFTGANPMAEGAYLDNWGYQRAPWPWHLADPHAINDYLSETYDSTVESDHPASTGNSDTAGPHVTIALEPNTIEARPGETVRLNIQYTQLQGVSHVVLMASAEQSVISNLPPVRSMKRALLRAARVTTPML